MKPRNRGRRGLLHPLSAFSLACSALLTTPLLALDYIWTGTTSNVYNINGNWNPTSGNPGTADNVLIDTSATNPTTVPTGNWDRSGTGTTTIDGTGALTLGATDVRFYNKGAFNMLGGRFTETNGQYFIVGTGGVGVFTQSGGTVDATLKRGFFLSNADGDSGSVYNLSAGTLSVKSAVDSTVAEELRGIWFGKGYNGTSTDMFNVTGSTATFEKTGSATSHIQLSGSAELNIASGTVTFDKYTEARIGYLAATADRQAKINVTSGTLNFTNATGSTNVRVGYNDKGLLKVDGGTVNIKGMLSIGTFGNAAPLALDAGEGLCQISAGSVNVTGNLGIGTGTSKGTLVMTGGTLTVTNTGTDAVGQGANGNATVTLSGNSVLNAATTKWYTGNFSGTANPGITTITLSDSAALTLRELTIGHIGGTTATETVTLGGNSALTVNNFITIGRDDNDTKSGISSFLNLNGGTLATSYIQKGSDDSTSLKNNVNANGGTIKALATQPDFFKIGTRNPGRVYVNLQSGGLNFDTNGFDVAFQGGLHGNGGLTKSGAGTLTLSNLDEYTGTTTVSSGTLQVTTGNVPSSALMLADGATLATVGDASKSWITPDLTLGSTNGADIEFRNFDPQPGTIPIDAINSLTTHGTVNLKIGGSLRVGIFPLIGYPIGGTIGGSGFAAFKLPPLPRGVAAKLIDSNHIISLNVTAINALNWKGNVDANWDVNATANWTLGGTADKYQQNDNLRFDDLATRTAVTLNSVVAPAGVAFDNTSKDYTVSGTGGIAGTTTLTKTGDGTLTLATTNTFTGITTVNAGTLQLGDGVTDGSLASPLMVNQANVIFNPATSSVLSGTLGGFNSSATLTKTGAGTQVFTGSANTYEGPLAINEGTFQIGDGAVNSTAGANTIYHIATGASLRFNAATAFTPAWQKFTGAGVLALHSAQAVNGSANWGDLTLPSEFTGTLLVENGRVSARLGKDSLGQTAGIRIASGSQFLAFTSADPYGTPIEIAGEGWGEVGFTGGLRLAGGATATWAGSVTLTADSGIRAQNGSNFTVTGQIGGPFQCKFLAGEANASTLNVAPAAQNTYGSTLIDGNASGSVVAGNGFAFSPGPLKVTNSILKLNGNSFSFANLSGTGGVIGNFNDSAPATLTIGSDGSSTAFGGIIKDGTTGSLAIVKNGTGTLSLTGANTYSGDTTVNEGTLSVSTPFLANSSTVSLASGTKIDLATGAADTIGKLVIDGVTVPQGTYDSSHPIYGTYFTGTGSLVIVGGYSSWATTNNLDATNNGLTQDPDNDGISNLMEFYLNGNPLGSDTGILPLQTSDADSITFTFSRRDDAEADVGSQLVQYGVNLTDWTNVPVGAASSGPNANGVTVNVAENAANADAISVRIPRTNAVGGKLFGRLKVSK